MHRHLERRVEKLGLSVSRLALRHAWGGSERAGDRAFGTTKDHAATVSDVRTTLSLTQALLCAAERAELHGVLPGDPDADGDERDSAGDLHGPAEPLAEEPAEGCPRSAEDQRDHADHRQRYTRGDPECR